MPSLKRLVLLALACSIAGTVARAEIVWGYCPRVADCNPIGPGSQQFRCDQRLPQFYPNKVPVANNVPCRYEPRTEIWQCSFDARAINRASSYIDIPPFVQYRLRVAAPCLCNSVNGRTQC